MSPCSGRLSEHSGKIHVAQRSVQCLFMAVISMGRRNTLVFDGKMECWNELQAPDIFYQ